MRTSKLHFQRSHHAPLPRRTAWALPRMAVTSHCACVLVTSTTNCNMYITETRCTMKVATLVSVCARVLAHGYSVNHTALALHRLPPPLEGAAGTQAEAAAAVDGMSVIENFVARLQACGLDMNTEGGVVKVRVGTGCRTPRVDNETRETGGQGVCRTTSEQGSGYTCRAKHKAVSLLERTLVLMIETVWTLSVANSSTGHA